MDADIAILIARVRVLENIAHKCLNISEEELGKMFLSEFSREQEEIQRIFEMSFVQ